MNKVACERTTPAGWHVHKQLEMAIFGFRDVTSRSDAGFRLAKSADGKTALLKDQLNFQLYHGLDAISAGDA